MSDWSTPSTFQRFYYKPVHSSTFAHAVLFSGVHSSWVAPLQYRSLDQRLDIADICLVYLYCKHCHSEVFPLLSDIKISTLVFV